VEVQKSRFLLLPASTVERASADQYQQLLKAAAQKKALNTDKAQLERLRGIAKQLIGHAARFNPDAQRWKWEVNLIRSPQVNAFCMPGGKIAFFTGLLERLKLDDDEVAVVMGHEMAHALLEHGRARMSREVAKRVGISIAAAALNLGDLSATVLAAAADVAVTLPYARSQESDADLAGMEIAARAGHDPRAALRVWQKMSKLSNGGQPPQFLSTHPSHASRIKDLEAALPKVTPLYDRRSARP
jgi:Zn-dependent protease with chaperone function